MSFQQNQEENRTTSAEETEQPSPGNPEQAPSNIAVLQQQVIQQDNRQHHVHYHQHVDHQSIQVDQRQNITNNIHQPEQSNVSSGDQEGKKLRKREVSLFLSELYKKTQEVAANHNDKRSIIGISKILRERNDEEVTVAVGSHFDGGWIWMRASDSQNDILAVTSFIKLMPGRIGYLYLYGCKMNSNQFRPWKESIKSMPGSIVWLNLQYNFLSVHDVIEVMSKVEEKVAMGNCLDDGDGEWRDANMMERSMLQKALDGSNNKKLKISFGSGDVIIHKDRDD